MRSALEATGSDTTGQSAPRRLNGAAFSRIVRTSTAVLDTFSDGQYAPPA